MKKTLTTLALAGLSLIVMETPTSSSNVEKSSAKKVEVTNGIVGKLDFQMQNESLSWEDNQLQEQLAFENMMTAMFSRLGVSTISVPSLNKGDAEVEALRLQFEALQLENVALKDQVAFANMMTAAFLQLQTEKSVRAEKNRRRR